MGLWSRIADFAQRKAGPGGIDAGMMGMSEGWGQTGSGVPVNSFSAMQHVAVMACVSILSEDVAKLPLQIWKRLPNGGKTVAKDHYLYKLLRNPNSWQTQFEFIEMMQSALVLRGRAPAAIIRDGRANPIALVPIHPDRTAIWEAPDGQYFFLVSRQGLHEMAALDSLPLMIPSDDMLDIRWMSSWNSLLPMSRIGLMREAIGLGMSLEQQAARFTAQGARPGGVLQTDAILTKEVREQLKESWQKNHGGWRNAGGTAVLEQGVKWQPLGMSMVDAEFIASRELQLQEIGRGFRVPLYKLGVPSEGGGPSLAQQDQEYLNTTIVSYCTRWKTRIEKTFGLDGEEYFVEFDYAHFLKADIGTRYNAYRVAIVGGFKTPNEVRRLEGDPDDPKGNVLLQPTNMAPLGWVPPASGSNAGPGSDSTGAPGLGGDGDALAGADLPPV